MKGWRSFTDDCIRICFWGFMLMFFLIELGKLIGK